MLAPWVRVEGCARCAHGTTGKRTSLPQFFENPQEKLPASSIVLFRAPGFDAWPRFPRPPHFPLSSASSPKTRQCHPSFCTSGAMFLQNPSNCCQHVSTPTSPGRDDLHDERRHDDPVYPVETSAWYIVEESIDFVGTVCVGALNADSCSHRSSPRFLQNFGNIDFNPGGTSTQLNSGHACC